ncbi:hypothetical protein [Aeoliella sp. SH292]|uniref:hypothetical protein n=1 Tax=Aeoliella sp. SH292 TaxID=3454464 RepID=UPI003F946A68
MNYRDCKFELPVVASHVWFFLALAFTCALGDSQAATVDRYWEVSPYRVQVLLDDQLSASWQARLADTLPVHLRSRARSSFGPMWRLTIDALPPGSQRPTKSEIVALSDEALSTARREFDKLIVLQLKESKIGFEVLAQEYDSLLEKWGPIWRATTREGAELPELAFSQVCEAFTPMATFRVNREDPTKVELQFRGSKLPRVEGQSELVSPGQVMRPYLRRTDRDGLPVEDGIQPVAWTYLTLDEGESPTATIVSHTKAPLGTRQRGRIDQLATIVRPSGATTQLRLHSRASDDEPLAGFRVYRRDSDSEENEFIGKSDDDGAISIPSGKTPIQIAMIQSGGQWIAKIPVVPGVDGVVNAPLADDRKRLEAEGKLAGIHEELIDLVARRNILASRIRVKIKARDLEGANALIRELEGMPSATEFEQQRIRQQERLVTSSDPKIQARIEQMFNQTRDVLAEFLAPGLVQELKREAAGGASASTGP